MNAPQTAAVPRPASALDSKTIRQATIRLNRSREALRLAQAEHSSAQDLWLSLVQQAERVDAGERAA